MQNNCKNLDRILELLTCKNWAMSPDPKLQCTQSKQQETEIFKWCYLQQSQKPSETRNKPSKIYTRAPTKKLTLLGEIKRPKCRNVWNSWIGRPNTLKILILVQLIYKINAILAKIPQDFFFSNTILIFIWKLKEATRGRGRRPNLKDLHDSKGDLFESHSNPSTVIGAKI